MAVLSFGTLQNLVYGWNSAYHISIHARFPAVGLLEILEDKLWGCGRPVAEDTVGFKSSNGSQPVREIESGFFGGLIKFKTKPYWEPRVVIVVWTCARLYEGAARGL